MNISINMKDDFIYSIFETRNLKSQIYPLGLSEVINTNVEICRFNATVRHLTQEEMYQKFQHENKKLQVNRLKNQENDL
jgi:hypothetical protein